MKFMVIIFFLIIVSTVIAKFFSVNIESTMATTIFIVIIVQYIFGLLGSLKLGYYACVVLGVIAFIYLLIDSYKKRKINIDKIITPALLFFLVFFLVNWIVTKGHLLSAWDEFSHWGLVAKNMYEINDFGSNPIATTHFKGYPPATALFQYFWNNLYGSFQEDNLFLAMNILHVSLIIPIFSKIYKTKFSSFFLVSLILLILPVTFFSKYYVLIYVDATLGLLFFYILFTYFSTQKLDKIDMLNIVLACSILVLTKASGTGLAAIGIVIMSADMFFNKKDTKISNKLLCIITLFLTVLFSKKSWGWHLIRDHANEAWETKSLTFSNVLRFIGGHGKSYQKNTYKNFVHYIFSERMNANFFNMTFFVWVVLSIVLSLVLFYLVKGSKLEKSIKIVLIGMHIGGLVYVVSLLLLYLFTYSEYEANKLASISRYLNTYLLPVFLFLISMIMIQLLNRTEIKKQNKMLGVIVVSMCLFSNPDAFIGEILLTSIEREEIEKKRDEFINLEKAKNISGNATDRFFVISQNTNGLDFWIARYTLTPIQSNIENVWSLGESYNDNDIWTKDITLTDWSNTLKNSYKYVYIHRTDEQFNKKYGKIFDEQRVENKTVYRIQKSRDKIKLVKLHF